MTNPTKTLPRNAHRTIIPALVRELHALEAALDDMNDETDADFDEEADIFCILQDAAFGRWTPSSENDKVATDLILGHDILEPSRQKGSYTLTDHGWLVWAVQMDCGDTVPDAAPAVALEHAVTYQRAQLRAETVKGLLHSDDASDWRHEIEILEGKWLDAQRREAGQRG